MPLPHACISSTLLSLSTFESSIGQVPYNSAAPTNRCGTVPDPKPANGTEVSYIQEKVVTFSSSKVKPLPKRFFILYRTVWPLTTGLRGPAAGLGKTLAAFTLRAASANLIDTQTSTCKLNGSHDYCSRKVADSIEDAACQDLKVSGNAESPPTRGCGHPTSLSWVHISACFWPKDCGSKQQLTL